MISVNNCLKNILNDISLWFGSQVHMTYGHCLAAFLTTGLFIVPIDSEAEEKPIDTYGLPTSKVNLDSCQKQALQQQPGNLIELTTFHIHGRFFLKFKIREANSYSTHTIICDLENGIILH